MRNPESFTPPYFKPCVHFWHDFWEQSKLNGDTVSFLSSCPWVKVVCGLEMCALFLTFFEKVIFKSIGKLVRLSFFPGLLSQIHLWTEHIVFLLRRSCWQRVSLIPCRAVLFQLRRMSFIFQKSFFGSLCSRVAHSAFAKQKFQ